MVIEKIKKHFHLELENVAVPEVRFDEDDVTEQENKDTDSMQQKHRKTKVDYSGAVPEIIFVDVEEK